MSKIIKQNSYLSKQQNNNSIKIVIIIGISIIGWKCLDRPKEVKFTKSIKLSLCEKIDSVLHQQKRKFRDIKEEAYFMRQDTEVYYRCAINMSADSSDIIYKYEDNLLFFRGYFKNDYDSIHSVHLFDSLKQVIKRCLPDWETHNLIDVDRIFPFTRFIKDSTQIELYYMKNGIHDTTYTVGMVVEPFK